MSGDLRIVVSADLGEFGPTDGKPILYHFSPLYHVQGFIPWLLLPLAFIVLKENRTAQAVWILAPVAGLGVVYWAATMVIKPTSGSMVQTNTLFTAMTVGFSLVWLLGERIGNRNPFVAFLLAALVSFGFLGVNLFSRGFGKDVTAISVLAATMILPMLLALGVAAFLSSKRFRKVRFAVWTGVCLFGSQWIIVSTVTLLFNSNRPIAGQIAEVSFASLVISLLCCVCLLPFLILLWTNRFWRRRFECVTRIRVEADEVCPGKP